MPNVDLLIRGAEALEADAANPKGVRFDLELWGAPFDSTIGEATGTEDPGDLKTLKVNCGTTACAMGFFCVAKTFKKEGLIYDTTNFGGDNYQIIPWLKKKDGDEHSGFHAAQYLFDITFREACHLFQSDHYVTAQGAEAELAVAKRMRQVAAGENYQIDPSFEE